MCRTLPKDDSNEDVTVDSPKPPPSAASPISIVQGTAKKRKVQQVAGDRDLWIFRATTEDKPAFR